MASCGICSKADKKLVKRWYQYDNGEQFVTYVCVNCADVHAQLLQTQTEKG
jgi:uncharacterized Zn finger protein